ncbi:MAG: hypothetical protein WKG07_43670 [Hymenobacter sp.]
MGPTFMFGGDKLKLEVRGLAGVNQMLGTPELTVQLEDDPTNTFTQKSSHSLTFGYAAGVGVHYALTDKLAWWRAPTSSAARPSPSKTRTATTPWAGSRRSSPSRPSTPRWAWPSRWVTSLLSGNQLVKFPSSLPLLHA